VTLPAPLLLDEMHAPTIAEELCRRGHDVIAVAASPELRAMTDDDLFRTAATAKRRIVTENVKDYRRLLHQAEEAGTPTAGVLFTSSRRFPRHRKNPGPLIEALDAWPRRPDRARRPPEDWLMPAGG
jgi:nucleoside-diphosphate-sugar epimerase